jgi:anti-sigma factor RsiW
MFTPPYQDDAIVAWLDGEMSEADAQRFESQLAQDEQLASRTEALKQDRADFAGAFAPLLNEAPEARMQARLNELLASPRASTGVSRRSLIAASLSFLVIGSGFGYFARPLAVARDESEKIRDLEAQYMSLYSAETLLDADSSPTALQRGLARTAQDIGLSVKVAQLVLTGAELKMVRMLRYDSTSIAQIAWMDAEYGPMALCISPERHAQTRALTPENRHDMHLVWWQQRGYQFVLIGRNPPQQLSQHAQALHAALS